MAIVLRFTFDALFILFFFNKAQKFFNPLAIAFFWHYHVEAEGFD